MNCSIDVGCGLESRASLENPSTPLSDPAAWFTDTFNLGPNFAGETVTPATSIELAPMWRGIRLLSGDVAKLPLCVYQRTEGNRGKEPARMHPAYKLLKNRAHPHITAQVLKETLAAQAIWRGNGYARIYRNNVGSPIALEPLRPDTVYPTVYGGMLYYVVEYSSQSSCLDIISPDFSENPHELRRKVLTSDEVLHVKGLGDDGICGFDIVSVGRQILGSGLATLRYGGEFFANGAKMDGIIKSPRAIDNKARATIKSEFERWHGSGNRHTVAVLDSNYEYQPVSYDPDKTQLVDMRKFGIREVANLLGIPPHKLGDESRTSFASLEQANQEYLDEALDPWLCKFEAECWDKLLTERQKASDSHVIEFKRQALLRADLVSRTTAFAQQLQNGVISRNEWRNAENMNPVEDEDGDAYYMPLNVGKIGEEPEPLPEPEPEPEADDEGEDIDEDEGRAVLSAVKPIVAALGKAGKTAAKKEKRYTDWAAELPATWRAKFEPQAAVCRMLVGGRYDDFAERFLMEASLRFLNAGDGEPARFSERVDNVCNQLDQIAQEAFDGTQNSQSRRRKD